MLFIPDFLARDLPFWECPNLRATAFFSKCARLPPLIKFETETENGRAFDVGRLPRRSLAKAGFGVLVLVLPPRFGEANVATQRNQSDRGDRRRQRKD